MDRKEILSAIEAASALENKYKYNKALTYFTDIGVNSRDKYLKHMELMKATKTHNICAFVGGNGTGKSLFETLLAYWHASGNYPEWWDGFRFKNPIDIWMCARETKALREGIQELLFGSIADIGTGILPKDCLLDDKGNIQTWTMSGTANCIGQCLIKHHTNGIFDGYSKIDFKTYAQGWAEFQGPTRQLIMLDEEPDDDKIYAECLARTRPKDGGVPGHLMAFFTPTQGYSKTYLAFVPNGIFPHGGEHVENPLKYTVQVTWNDVPHLPETWKQSQIAEWKIADPGNIEARTMGVAAMGSGRVYPIDESFVVVPKIRIPEFWKRAYGMDPGHANFATVWVCQDPNTGTMYVYDEYKHGKVVYLLHAEAIRNRGEYIHGGIDPHEAVKPRDTGESIQSYFESQGLNLIAAKGDPDALRVRIRAMFESGALKLMDSCPGIINETRTYRFDSHDPNKIAPNQEDHRLDALMYAICIFDRVAISYAEFEEEQYSTRNIRTNNNDDGSRSNITGY